MIDIRIYEKIIIDDKEFSKGTHISLRLKDGREVSGVITNITKDIVTLKFDDITFYKVNIRNVESRI